MSSSAEPSTPELDGLNSPQSRAVAHVDGPLLIFAGAGSGKTRVIVYRIAHLVATCRVPPYRILAVTFTNKAAGEMRRRLGGLLGDDVAKDLWVGTFHATCARLLRRYHEAAGLDRSFVIYDDDDQKKLMARVLVDLGLDDKRYPVRQVLSRIHAEKQEGRGPAEFARRDYVDDAIAKCFDAYERRLRAANAVDFDDLLLHVLHIVEDPKSLPGEELRKKFRYVLVDEFQDVNHVQYRLVRAFAAATQNLCVVGDDDQSIYRWRGADVRIVRGFRHDFPSAEVVKLEQNYRSSGNIVQAALGVIRPARDREPKELWTDRPPGAPIVVTSSDSEHDEAAFVAARIKKLLAKGVSPREIAIFYRVNAQSRVLEELMLAEKIPYQIIGGMRFFDRAEVKDLLSYLRAVDNPKSDVDVLRIINTPARKIGSTTIDKLLTCADRYRCSVLDAILPLTAEGQLGTAARRSLIGFKDMMDALRAEARDATPSEIAREVLDKSGYEAMLSEDTGIEAESRLDNLMELVGAIQDYEIEARAADETPTLSGYLERVSLVSDVDSLEDAPKVAMMTVHAAKGLEFRAVFLTGMEEELFPFRSADALRNDDTEEERRLAYVAITRAREELFVTYASRRMIFGAPRYARPSPFLRDVPPAIVKTEATPSAAMLRAGRSQQQASFARPEPSRGAWTHPQARAATKVEPVRAPGERYVEPDVASEGPRRGQSVVHERFGSGVIESIDPGHDPVATVKFSAWGTKRIKARYLRFDD